MPKINLKTALAEKAEADGDFCQCGAPADDDWAPHCRLCGSYWADVDAGLFSDADICEAGE